MTPEHFPFYGKPMTNVSLQVLAFATWIATCVLWPSVGLASFIVAAACFLFVIVRSIYRDIRKEWKS
jgi:Flp pilus assembly protein TadB